MDEGILNTNEFMIIEISSEKWWKQNFLGAEYNSICFGLTPLGTNIKNVNTNKCITFNFIKAFCLPKNLGYNCFGLIPIELKK